jgi:hypothetical protein
VQFLNLVAAAMTAGRAHLSETSSNDALRLPFKWGWRAVVDENTGEQRWRPLGERIGWIDDATGIVYLEPDAAFACVQKLARDQGETFPITQATLWKRVADRGLLAERYRDNGYKARRVLSGARRYAIAILALHLEGLCHRE